MPLMIKPWKVVRPPFGLFEVTAKMKSSQVFGSSRASLHYTNVSVPSQCVDRRVDLPGSI